MAKVEQVYAIVNDIASQVMGEKAVTVVDTSTMISLGDDVLKTDETLDLFVHALADRIGRTIISIRAYDDDDVGMVRHAFDYGIAMQKIYIDLPDAEENSSWKIGEEGFEPVYAPVIKPDVRQKIFSNATTFEIDMTIPDRILTTAFTNAEGMAALITAIFVAVDNRIAIAIENCKELVRASFIARKLKANNKCGAINLLTTYNAMSGNTLKANVALYDKDFLRWAATQVKLWSKRMRKMSVLFNDEGYKRHTPESELVLVLLDEFDASLTSYLDADTFHNELVSIPSFTTVPYWQGSGEDFEFSSTSTISVKLDDTTTVTASGIIAVAYDYQALGMMIDDRKTTTERNNRSEYTNYYSKVTRSYFNDMSENGIVFYISDSASPLNLIVNADAKEVGDALSDDKEGLLSGFFGKK